MDDDGGKDVCQAGSKPMWYSTMTETHDKIYELFNWWRKFIFNCLYGTRGTPGPYGFGWYNQISLQNMNGAKSFPQNPTEALRALSFGMTSSLPALQRLFYLLRSMKVVITG